MASKAASASASASRSEPPEDPPPARTSETVPFAKEIVSVIDAIKEQVAADRCTYVKKKIAENKRKLVGVTTHVYNLSRQRRNDQCTDNVTDNNVDLLAKRQADALGMQIGIESSNADKESNSNNEEGHTSTAVLLGSSIPVKNAVRPIKLPEIKRLPPYTTWIFLDSCLIARNLLTGLKTCWEVFQYMNFSENKLLGQGVDGSNCLGEGFSKFDYNGNVGNNEARRRSRFLRRRGRVRRLKYTWKSAAYHSIRKRITERKDQPCRQYNPCNCQTACGKQCSCLLNGTCCEKYCGCPKSCKNRFRGCHCAKSQCRSRQCPCFAADRECDPDVCRNCWVSCGDGTLGVPNQRGDNYECRNMKLLLKQQQRVLLGRSDVSGWGAFLKYTGELISHREADKRGKIYDRENSSFLFNLNDQFVLDAYRKGDKLKFANHSPDPNCYAKVIMVAGDHRVGIFAKERIEAGEELFYDYRYEPDRAPAWARKPEASGAKKEDGAPSTGRAKKLA
ncbi:hypothetical protein CRG98_027997 [Punica granatum]|uniref:Uncharacterized protein n=1 Tax=Punica granatum TaxID=22663 RepID=A0A2I0J5W4_PUNGR|nr:hypothetical protein CRG98_027997 [Punica granatum]